MCHATEQTVEFFSDLRVLWVTFVSYKQIAVLYGSIGNIFTGIFFVPNLLVFNLYSFSLISAVISSDQDEWNAGECIPRNVLEVFRRCDNAISSVACISV